MPFIVPQDAPARWQTELQNAFRSPDALLAAVGVPLEALPWAIDPQFPMRVPRSFAARIRHGDPTCPLLLQVLSTAAEGQIIPGFSPDPLAEATQSPVPGLLHKFHNRVLLTLTAACPIHCRYCFRRHFPYTEHQAPGNLAEICRYIREHPEIDEVIWSGGDPLSLSDDRLIALGTALEAIPHLRYLRIHTRFPIVIPTRCTPQLLEWLRHSRLRPAVVLHSNHPNEIDSPVLEALHHLRHDAGVLVLTQTVLLKGINDDAGTLAALIHRLYAVGVLPYYLHLLDRVQGSAHFEIPDARAHTIYQALTAQLPGFLLPRLVREIPGAPAKVVQSVPQSF